MALVEAGVRSRDDTASSQLLAIFDVLGDLFHRGDRNARTFVDALAEIGRGRTSEPELAVIEDDFRMLVETLTHEARLVDTPGFVSSFRLLVNGAVLKAVRGDLDAARRARRMANDLVIRHSIDSTSLIVSAHPVEPGSWLDLDLDAYARDLPAAS